MTLAWWDDGVLELEDTDAFKAYVAEIERLLSIPRKWPDGRPKGWTLGDLHLCLGADANRNWTLHAIDFVSNVEELGAQPVRYRILERTVKTVVNGELV